MYDTLKLETDARGVASVWLVRPEKHNALSARLIADLHAAADALASDEDVRVVVLAAEGESFCAGADLAWMRAQFEASPEARRDEANRLARMLQALNTLPKPLIARVQGQAFGGGIGLLSVCDAAIGTNGARFALSETRLGLIPATIGPYVAARLGPARARRVFMTSRRFDAAEAVRLGLLSAAVPEDSLDEAVAREVAPCLACAPGAVSEAKALLRSFGPVIDEAVIARSVDALVACWDGDEAREGVSAFFDKRTPNWATE
ncbi:MAG: crotonase/enoyl-CoA hydratase family protein [Pseudomonadota bacterium]